MSEEYDAIIIGAGASGLMCAATAAEMGAQILLLEAGAEPGRKIACCGGGKANVTNSDVSVEHYVSENPMFAKSAISRYRPDDFLDFLSDHDLGWELRDGGCYFGTQSSRAITSAFVSDIKEYGSSLLCGKTVSDVSAIDGGFSVECADGSVFTAPKVVIAAGGCTYPSVGGTRWGLDIASSFGLRTVATSSVLAPLKFSSSELDRFGDLAGIALQNVTVSAGGSSFRGSLVFRPDGIGGIAVFKASLPWSASGGDVLIDFLPDLAVSDVLERERTEHGARQIANIVGRLLPRRLSDALLDGVEYRDRKISGLTRGECDDLSSLIHLYRFTPLSTGKLNEAEVMLGGVAVDELSSRTFESRNVKGLYFIGEVVDVTGQLGGYNLHWAWASGHAAGLAL